MDPEKIIPLGLLVGGVMIIAYQSTKEKNWLALVGTVASTGGLMIALAKR